MVTISTILDTKPVCSVCIANYNGVGLIEACIDSVLNQNWDAHVEIIVHDDASTDASVALIRECYPQVKLIESSENVGFCISNNRMAAQAHGKFILLLNNDAELFADALYTLHEHASNSTTPVILSLPQYAANTGKLIDIGNELDPFLNPIPNQKSSITASATLIGACLWLPKSVWDEIGGFPDWFDSIAEDMYLCCVARLWGYQVLALSQSGFRHWLGSSFGGAKIVDNKLSSTTKRRALSERNKTYVMIVSYPWLALAVILPVHILLLLLEGILITIAKRDLDIFQLVYSECPVALWKNRKRLKSVRCSVQAKKKISMYQFFSVFSWQPYKLAMLLRHGLPEIK